MFQKLNLNILFKNFYISIVSPKLLVSYENSSIAPVSSKEFFDIQKTLESRSTMKRVIW